MTSARLQREEAFRAALEAHDFLRAETALRDYIGWFKSGSRDLHELEHARNLLQWAIDLTSTRKVQIGEELMRLKSVFDAYLPPQRIQTWRVIG